MKSQHQPLIGAPLAQALISPRSVAIVGASDDATKTSGRPLQYLRRGGFQGTIYPINPRRPTVQGERSWPSLTDLPEVPEHVFVLSPTESVVETARECARLGVKVLTILASGFSEAGPEGLAREQALRDICGSSGLRIVGPSSLGVVNPRNGLMLTANAAFAEPELPVGKVLVASHSGSMIGALVSRGMARGVGFAGLVSVGNEVDLSIGEICASTLDDPAIEGYLLFLESLRHGPELQAFARAAHRAGKPVIAYKLGRSAAAAEMAMTHTGAIAGEDDIADAFFKDLGIARVGILEALLETFPLAKRIPLESAPKRVGIVTTTGGGAAMAVDQLGVRDVVVESPSAATLSRLEQAGLPCAPGRVLDLTLAGTKYETMKSALDILLSAPEFDLVLAVVGSSARFQPHLAVKPIVECAKGSKPLAAMLVPDAPEALASLTAAGVPCFRTPEACADAIAAVFARRQPGQEASPRAAHSARTRTLSEAEAYTVLDQLGVPHAPAVVRPFSGTTPPLPFGFPVVVKLCSADIPHKTEVGGVLLNIQNEQELSVAIDTLQRNLREKAPDAVCNEVLVQPMQKGLGEVLVGYRVDPEAGPIVMLAAGGIWAEVARDRSIRMAPVSIEAAREMTTEVNALKALTGLRGKARGDLEALAQAVCALSQLAIRPDLRIVEAEVNPLLVLPEGQGVSAVDALVFQA
ncbi:MAG: acetate--CoA ligase family protein [Hydrogenophaga sp.]|uniref:acetate--CoA ligase family protein n=1 Tax=Hydrogenophaga sp. TaxID=1904254 RepID=UPI002733E03C|nr:acetate--CoA ligase family protein [Hydrogenophaga sp.]MDP3626456.1 acetate--CoA ligase family protein [Hydrogenophaga sp.]